MCKDELINKIIIIMGIGQIEQQLKKNDHSTKNKFKNIYQFRWLFDHLFLHNVIMLLSKDIKFCFFSTCSLYSSNITKAVPVI